jgi:5'-deoxynucleotidase
MAYNFYAFMDRMKYIKRWSLMRSVREENIMEHSQQVAMLAHALAVINNKVFGGNVDSEKCVLYAIYHECSEVMTGDLPTPIKYFNNGIHGAYKELEDRACDKLLEMLPEEIRGEIGIYVKSDAASQEYKIVKAADRLAAYIKCLEEQRCGNTEFDKAKKSIEEDLHSRNMQEVEYFFDNFIKGFNLTLDELEGNIV